MSTPYLRAPFLTVLSLLLTAFLAACSDVETAPPPPPAAAPTPGNTLALTTTNRILSFNRDAPGTIISDVAVSGLVVGESLLGIDVRPADGNLYGLGSTGRVYTINASTGAATLRSTLTADAADTTSPYAALVGTEFAVDFNPVPDRMRVVSNSGLNLRINVDTGATFTDGAINGGAPTSAVSSAAYTNSFAGAGTTTLYDIDTVTDTLYIQSPPNDGTLASPVTLGVDASAAGGFDIDGRNNAGFAAFTVGGVQNLYRINLAATSNAATLVGAIGTTETLRGLALAVVAAPVVTGLTTDNRLVRFNATTPNTLTATVAITGLTGGETVLGIDHRPANGLLYAITSAGRIYTLDTATGAATLRVTLAADPADTTAPFTGIVGDTFAVDFNPVPDRMRVVSNTGLNLRINVDTGVTITDGIINQAGASPVVNAGAYANNFAGTTTTTLFEIATHNGNLVRQDPPNDGTLVNIGALGFMPMGEGGFDIAGGANGLAIAAVRTTAAGPSTLYRINLTTGAATLIGASADASLIGGASGPALRGLAIAL